jgi:hypothetical protein
LHLRTRNLKFVRCREHVQHLSVFIVGIFAAELQSPAFQPQNTANTPVFSFLLGKGRLSRDIYCVSGIINYDFELNVFRFPKSVVKMSKKTSFDVH